MNPSKEFCSEIESKIEIKENKQVMLRIKFDKEKDEIYKVYEISDNRLAVELDKSIKIYSLQTFKLLTEINNERINTSIELKNKDIALTNYYVVNFYKLSDNNYTYYQNIKEEEEIFEIYELKNENLIVCIRRQLNIYSKDKGEYKFSLKLDLPETVGNFIEVKNNILFLFLLSRSGTFATADYSPYYLVILNLEKRKMDNLCQGSFSRYDDSFTFYGCNFIIKKNKYLFARYADSFGIYNIEDIENNNIKCIYKINRKKNIEHLPLFFKTLCDYDDDNFIISSSKNIYKYDEKLNKIILVKKLEIGIEKIIDIKKLKNNKYFAHTKNDLLIINN